MFTAETCLYLRSPTRLAFLMRSVEFVFPPRVGEWVKLRNAEHGNYFAIRIAEVTHVEDEGVDVMLDALDLEEEELDQYVASYQSEGWLHKSTKPRWDVALTKSRRVPADFRVLLPFGGRYTKGHAAVAAIQ